MALKSKGIFIVGAKRTPFCKYGGALRELPASHAFAAAAKAAIDTAKVDPEYIDNTIVGNLHYLSQCDGGKTPRYCGIYSGVPLNRPALGVSKACGSGVQAVITGALEILTGGAQISLTGGTEIMSSLPLIVRNVRFGTTLGASYVLEDHIMKQTPDSYTGVSLQRMAEDMAKKYGVKRKDVDDYALKSYLKWKAAQKTGVFQNELSPLTVQIKKKEKVVNEDDVTPLSIEDLEKLPPLFEDGDIVTSVNSAAPSDGASAILLASEEAVKQHNLEPLARISGWSCVGLDPTDSGLGAVEAARRLMRDQGVDVKDVGLFEINEPFASQALITIRELGLEPERTNVSGGALALGNPTAASGARMVTHLVNQMRISMEIFFKELLAEDASEFSKFCRMSPTDFDFLLNKIEPMIMKNQTRLRMPIPPKIRLALTLRYLATGDSYRSLHYLFKISTPAISLIIPEVCKAINSVLKDQIKLPQTPAEWLPIEAGFRKKFPRCVGAIDGKHIVINCPPHSGSQYYNYKQTYSIVLMALVDSDYRFIFADIGGQGRISDGGIFQNCLLWQKINTDTINLPPDAPLPGREINVPYVFLGDGAFALHKHIMKPFPGNHNRNTIERTFNYKLSSSRVIVENVFGVLTTVFRIFKKPIEIDIDNVPTVTMTCILLHNFLRNSKLSRNIYSPPATFDSVVNGEHVDGSWRQNQTNPETSAIRPIADVPRRSPRNICEIRTEFAHYFHNINTENN